MKGTHRIAVGTREMQYEFSIRHKFSIILGDSGSGKTMLCELIHPGTDKLDEGVYFKSDLKAVELERISDIPNRIKEGYNLFFVDERMTNEVCRGDAGAYFGSIVKGTSAYFIFMTRQSSLSAIPFNVDAVYRIEWRKKGKALFGTLKNEYNWSNDVPICPERAIIEDSKAGFTFYKKLLCDEEGKICISAKGNSNIVNEVTKALADGYKKIFVVADGCGFGVYFNKLLKIQKNEEKMNGAEVRLFMPPSFEYLILDSGIFKFDVDKLINTQDYARIEKYMGWEAYYTDQLIECSGGAYSKGGKSLPKFLRNKQNMHKMKTVIAELE